MQTTDAPFRQAEDLPPRKEMYRALLKRDASYEGVFYLGVRTTGIFCRPTCPARKPKPENVDFFGSTREALTAGYRPCRRCTPMKPEGQVPEWLEGLLSQIEEDPARRWKDTDLRAAGLDPARVRRWFKRHHGMTFHAYQRSRRLGLAIGQIRSGDDIMGTAYDHGYESLSGFHDAFAHLFGETPGESRKASGGRNPGSSRGDTGASDSSDSGAGASDSSGSGSRAGDSSESGVGATSEGGVTHVVITRVLTPLGPLVAGATEGGLCLLEFADRPMLETQIKKIRKFLNCAVTPGSNTHIEQVEAELAEYFAGKRTDFGVTLVVPGTDFQKQVWDSLGQIPYGETRSYEEIARAIDNPKAMRAVGRANGANRIPIVIPCHRVVRADGSLGGYGGELWRKRFLLKLEGHKRYAEAQDSLPLDHTPNR
jgi:AraC family transcriptional regulator of adaptative response/methylated-DNA-[protein]-cysteine methyltransferase